MQPETKDKPKNRTANYIETVHEMSGPEQWDALAFKLIQQELAPKGFSEIKRGAYRGSVQSNIPFLPKKTVIKCQNLAAQCVRSYRERVRRELTAQIGRVEQVIKGNENGHKIYMDNLWVWQLKKKRDARKQLNNIVMICRGEIRAFKHALKELDTTGIK